MLTASDPMQPPDCTELSDLPDAALELIFSLCATKDTVPSLCLVCERWLGVYQRSNIPLPLLSLSGPLDCSWVKHHAKKLIKVGLLLCHVLLLLPFPLVLKLVTTPPTLQRTTLHTTHQKPSFCCPCHVASLWPRGDHFWEQRHSSPC